VHRGLRSDPEKWTDQRHKQGLAAEEEAIRFLASRGWMVLAHRWRVGRTEIDIVARRGVLVAFIEVKARRGEAFGHPFEAVTGAKRREIVRGARAWIDRFGAPSDIYRFDCIALRQGVLEHLEDAFRPGWR
jgi:putative endonuclease